MHGHMTSGRSAIFQARATWHLVPAFRSHSTCPMLQRSAACPTRKSASLVLYCNGPFCGKSKRLSSELMKAGYSHVRRFQLGIPVWRAFGGVSQIEEDGLLYVVGNDRTTVLIDARLTEPSRSPAIPQSRV